MFKQHRSNIHISKKGANGLTFGVPMVRDQWSLVPIEAIVHEVGLVNASDCQCPTVNVPGVIRQSVRVGWLN